MSAATGTIWRSPSVATAMMGPLRVRMAMVLPSGDHGVGLEAQRCGRGRVHFVFELARDEILGISQTVISLGKLKFSEPMLGNAPHW